MIHKLFEAIEKYPNRTMFKSVNCNIIGTSFNDLYIDYEKRIIKSRFGNGVIYDFKTDTWAEIIE